MNLFHKTMFALAVTCAACGTPQDPDTGVDVPSGSDSIQVPSDRPNPVDRPDPRDDRPNPRDDRPNPTDDRPDPTDDRPDPTDDRPNPTDGGLMCIAPQSVCAGACVNTQTDSMHCGMCGTACPMGQMCSMGACMASCMMPEVSCGMGAMARCSNLQTDTANCGACGTQCGMGQSCAAGMCTCPMGTTACGMGAMATCANTQTDAANCGGCGMACPMGNVCLAGACVAPCAAPRFMCGMSCTDRQTDSNNCGACGTVCPMAQACIAGVCACPMGQNACGMGAATTCVNQQIDNANCGACGTTCGMTQSCVAASCTCPMATPNACGVGAAATCRNFQTDIANCGACGRACAAGQMCAAGMCTVACAMPNILCGMVPMQICVAALTDNNNCGRCGNSCGQNGVCTAGACVPRNATPATAIPLVVPVNGTRVTVTGNNAGGAIAAAGQCDQRAVYYSVMVAVPTILYVDTFGSTLNTQAGIRLAGAMGTGACVNDSCGGQQSQTSLVVPAGMHLIEISGLGGAVGGFTLRVAAVPASNGGRSIVIAPDLTRQFIRGNTAAVGNSLMNVPGLPAGKKADVYYFMTCPATPAGALHVDTCQSRFDTMISILHGGGPALPTTAFDDDSGNATCVELAGQWSNINANAVPAGSGVHAIYVTGFNATEGLYTAHFSLACANNQVSVRGVCQSVRTLQTDAANCGAVGRVCPVNNSCVAGVCVILGGNTNPPGLTFTVSEGAGVALPNIGGMGGVAFNDACPNGAALIGIRSSEAGPFGGAFGTSLVVGHVEGICGTMAPLGSNGTAPQRVTFTRTPVNLPSHGATIAGPAPGIQIAPRDLLCPAGHVVVGTRGATNGTIVDSLALLCAPITSAGGGPFTLTLGATVLVGAVGGESNAITQVIRACPAGQMANGVVGRSGGGLDAFSLLCNAARMFQVQVNGAGTVNSAAAGGVGGANYQVDCPPTQMLTGAIVAGVNFAGGPALSQMRTGCRPISGLAGTGNWTVTTGVAGVAGPVLGAVGGAAVPAACAAGAVPVGFSTTIATYPAQILFHCSAPTQNPAGVTSIVAGANSPTVGSGGGAFTRRDCPPNTVATGLYGGAASVVDRIGLRCTPIVIR